MAPAGIQEVAVFSGDCGVCAAPVSRCRVVCVPLPFPGVAWGVYSLIGRRSGQPLLDTMANFLYSVPFTIVLSAIFITSADISVPGLLLAVASGALASGIGYAIWYAALPGLTAGRAATVQLSVPVIAALGGIVLLSEQVTSRLVVAAILTIGGIWIGCAQRSRLVQPSDEAN